MKRNSKNKKSDVKIQISNTWLVVITVVLIAAVAIFTNKPAYKFTDITVSDLQNLYNSSERSIVYVGSPTCTYCEQFNPIIKKVAGENDLVINYLDISLINTEEKAAAFNKIDKYFSEGQWGTPLVIITDNKKLDDRKINGLTQEAEVIKFFKETGFIK